MSAEELARRAVACKGWRWLDGSDWVNGDSGGDGDVFTDGGESSNYPRFGIRMNGEFFELEDYNPCDPREPLPNLADPATLGCLLALVHEAWGPRVVITEVIGPRASWLRITADGPGDRLLFQADPAHSLAERRVCALEAAPS